MADRYWVPLGTGNWNSTTNWSATSGGASGASVPTSADNVIFDANSGSGAAHYTVTVTDNSTCANFTFTPENVLGVTEFVVSNGFVIAGTFSATGVGTGGYQRVLFRSSTYGLTRDIQIATIGTVIDVDFRDIRITGTGGTLTGTRIGDLKGNANIVFSTPKTVYWTRTATGGIVWNNNAWSNTSTGTPNSIYFPLAQDTAVFTNFATIGLITFDAAIPYTGTIDVSARSTATTFVNATTFSLYGDWLFNALTTLNTGTTFVMRGRKTQILSTAGSAFNSPLEIDTFNGSVELGGALNMGSNTLTVTNGAFDTKNFSLTADSISSNNSNVRGITLGSSTVALSVSGTAIQFNATNLTFNAGTSQINLSGAAAQVNGGGRTFYNVSFTSTTAGTRSINNANTFNNVDVTASSSAGLVILQFDSNQTITGTLTVAGATAVRRIFVRSNTLGTQRTLSVGTLSATDCDFRDIAITGAAAGSSPTRAGDCGGNSGITFPAAKTVYWNLAGAQNWSATGWATSSGGAPAINNFPLAQDTAVFDNTGSITGAITIDAAWNIGTFDASGRTNAWTFSAGTVTSTVYGDWKFGTGVTQSLVTGTLTFSKRGTQTITSSGKNFNCNITIDSVTGIVQLADAIGTNSARNFVLTSGTFDAVSYNVSVGSVNISGSTPRTLKMGSGTWSLSSSTANVVHWDATTTTNLAFYKGTANIIQGNNNNNTRTFAGGGLSYNKFTFAGAQTNTTTFTGNNQFTELASTKTVAFTIALGTTAQTFGKWTVTGTGGNVVTLTGTGTNHILAGACTSGIDFLAMGSIGFSAASPGEFYAGINSTAVAAVAPVYLTAKPADSTRYWVNGSGNWSDTARWSTSSGGAGGASVPRSHDNVVFNSASNPSSYLATVDNITGGIRMKSLTIAGPASGILTVDGSASIAGIHGNVTLPATGITWNYAAAITLSSNSTGLTFTTNGVALSSSITVNGVDCSWSLGSVLDTGASNGITVTNGTFSFETYNYTGLSISSSNANSRTINLGSSIISLSGNAPINFGTTETNRANLTITPGTSQINCSSTVITFSGNNQTFYNVSLTGSGSATTINGANSFNNLSFAGRTVTGVRPTTFSADQTVTGTLTFSAGTNATARLFTQSDTIGTTRTITAAAVSMTDVDFRDITIAGAAAPASGTRIGDCKGNSGITFTAAANKYWNLAAGGNWGGAIAWATSSGGAPAVNNFPLAQDTCVFEATGLNSGATITINAAYNIGTIDMSARTANTMTLALGTTSPVIYGNWINGTGTTLSGTNTLTFAGRTTQQLTSAGRSFPGVTFTINTIGGSLTLQDAFTHNSTLNIISGTFDANGYNVSITGGVSSNVSTTRTIAVGGGTWTLTTDWNAATSTNLTVTGTGTISLTSASAKTFAGGDVSYTNITLNQGGAGTLTISGNNTLKDITNTYKATGATTIDMGTTTQRVSQWTAAGEAGRLLTIQGTSASSPCTLIHTGTGTAANVDYLVITGVRAY